MAKTSVAVVEEEILQDEGFDDEIASGLSLSARLSSLLFVSPKPLAMAAFVQATGATVELIEAALEEVKEKFQDEVHGFSLHEIAGGYQLRTCPQVARTIKRLVPLKSKRLSRAAAETLAVIAYKQPVQRAEIEAIRGVDALPTLKTLLDAKLVRIVGKEDSIGHPTLYGTTQIFLEKFGLRDLADLPSVRDLEDLAAEPGEVDEDSDEDSEVSASELN